MEQPTLGLTLSPDASVDLQLHTTYSDGTWTPDALVDHLVRDGFSLAAVTDHDRVDSVAEVQRIGAQRGLPLLASVEMSTSWRGELTDVLCYGFDPARNELLALGEAVIRRQEEINREVYAELRRKGYTLPEEGEVLAEIGGRPLQPNDIAHVLERYGYRSGPGSLGKIMTDAGFDFATNDIALVVDAAHRSGAICLVAHPGRGVDFTLYDAPLLDDLRAEVPIDGLEAYYPLHTPEQTAAYLAYARKHNLLVSSGSDSHGPEKPPVKYRADLSRLLLKRLGIGVE